MPLLDVKNINLSFGGLKVIKDLSFNVETGSIVSLIGPNGAGKTSVFNCLTGFYRPNSGQIMFDGRSIMRKKPHKITKRGMARTFQNLRLFKNMTALENVMSGMHCRTSAGALGAIIRPPSQRKEEDEIRRLDRARADLPEMALLLAVLTEDEAYDLCQDIISSIKKRKIFNADEMSAKVQKLRVVK